MRTLIITIPLLLAGCATERMASANEVQALRAEVQALKAEVKEAKDLNAYRQFKRGRRVSRPKDRRNDLPKGVAR